ncbi:VOC family protein [Qipengyuania sp. CAU 1752]
MSRGKNIANIIAGGEPSHWTFDHLGVVVKSLARGRGTIGPVFGITSWTEEHTDPVNGVRLQFGRDRAGVVYELLEPIGDDSPVAGALKSRKDLLNHVAYLIEDLDRDAAHIRAQGAVPTSEPRPAIAYDGARIQFFMTAAGFVFELIEAPGHSHKFIEEVR